MPLLLLSFENGYTFATGLDTNVQASSCNRSSAFGCARVYT